MSQIIDRIRRRLSEAEGYLGLNMPERALEILQSQTDWATMQFEASYLTGETFRVLGNHREALKPLEVAAKLRPGDVGVAVALGWCYKRTHRLAQAIDSLARALRTNPNVPILHYNLACYWSLAGHVRKALDALATALDLDVDSEIRMMIPAEPDFNLIRSEPEFTRLVGEAGWIP